MDDQNCESGNLIWVNRISQKYSLLLSLLFIVVLTTIVYSQILYSRSVDNEFVNFDDSSLIVNNLKIRSLTVENLKKIFTPRPGSTYQPVRNLSYAIDYRFWKLNPVGYQIFNLLLHCSSGILLFFVLAEVLIQIRPSYPKASCQIISLFSALLFVAHPINVESVVWISSRKYGLLALFSFSSIFAYCKSWKQEKIHWPYLFSSYVAALLAILSSPFGIVLPTLFFLFDYCRDSRNNLLVVLKRRFWAYCPFLLAGLWVLPPLFRGVLKASTRGGAEKAHYMGNPLYTLFTMLRVLFDYFRNLFTPLWLNIRYVDYHSSSILNFKIIVAILIIVLLFSYLIYTVKKGDKLPLFCVGWFFITWLPVANIIPISTKMADRYMYLPAIGFFLALALGIFKILQLSKPFSLGRNLIPLLGAMVLLFYAWLGYERTKVWENSVTLWEDSLKKDEKNYIAHYSLGSALIQKNELGRAIYHTLKALKLRPNFAKGHYNLGLAYLGIGDSKQAIYHFKAALEIKPKYLSVYNNLGIALARVRKYHLAEQVFIQSLKLDPENTETHSNLRKIRTMIQQSAGPQN